MREYVRYSYFIVFLASLAIFLITAPTWVICGCTAIASYICLIEEYEENNGETTDNEGESGESNSDSHR